MKIIKKKEVVSEEVEVIPGIYYFQNDLIDYKIVIYDQQEGYSPYWFEKVVGFGNQFGISINTDSLYSEEEIPYYFKQFYLGIEGKKIEEKEFNEVKEEVLKRIAKQEIF